MQERPDEEEEEEIGGSYEFVGGVVTVTPAASKGVFLLCWRPHQGLSLWHGNKHVLHLATACMLGDANKGV